MLRSQDRLMVYNIHNVNKDCFSVEFVAGTVFRTWDDRASFGRQQAGWAP
jgi:hypothetical protein